MIDFGFQLAPRSPHAYEVLASYGPLAVEVLDVVAVVLFICILALCYYEYKHRNDVR